MDNFKRLPSEGPKAYDTLKYCINCGGEKDDEAKSCEKCGYVLSNSSKLLLPLLLIILSAPVALRNIIFSFLGGQEMPFHALI